jgi:tryptophan-rich sensory protein
MLLKIVNLFAFGLMVYINYLANSLPINNKTTGQLSEQYPNLFTPAGVTFSIWGIIYLLLLVVAIIQFREQNKQMIQAIGWAFAISCLLNALWIIAWHYEQVALSVIIIAGMLITLLIINRNLLNFSPGFSRATFGIYLGWICIATIANVTALLVNYNWGAWGISQETWTIIMIVAGTGITALAVYKLENPFVGLAVIWAFAGIILKRQNDFTSIVIASAIAIVIVSLVTISIFYRQLSAEKIM